MTTGKVRAIKKLEDSLLYQQLREREKHDPEIERLRRTVEVLAAQSEEISRYVIRAFPQYTLHDGRHLWNVLSWTEAINPLKLNEWTPLECGLTIAAVFVHDLAMVPTDEELIALGNPTSGDEIRLEYNEFLATRPTDEKRLTYLLTRPAGEVADELQLLLGHLRTDFLRQRHTRDSREFGSPIRSWLRRLMGENTDATCVYHTYDYTALLGAVAASHGQPLSWFARRFETLPNRKPKDTADAIHVGEARPANPFLAVCLLRLADIMDFDASRSPAIVFRNLGIKHAVSIAEWQKHLAIDVAQWTERDNRPPLLEYLINSCPSPAIHKSIVEFCESIRREIQGVREWLDGRDTWRPFLRLPELPTDPGAGISPSNYIFLDTSFNLREDAVLELLMGDSLYSSPELCIRELLQNALDAVQLRDLRHQMHVDRKQSHGIGPVDPLGSTDELHVDVSWGDCEGQEYLRLKDNGVGMSRRTLAQFFTQIGRSYYRSAEFYLERRKMKDAGLVLTPISYFGIGAVSAFMIADRMEIRTRPGTALGAAGMSVEDKTPYDLTVAGPTALFWLSEGTLDECGTEVTLWLKPHFGLYHKPSGFLASLGKLLYGIHSPRAYDASRESDGKKYIIDPAIVACTTAMWPLYSINIRPPRDAKRGEKVWRADDRFHIDHVLVLDTSRIRNMAKRWRVPQELAEKVRWSPLDWVDPVTGSRIRILGVTAGLADSNSSWGFLHPATSPAPLTSVQMGALIEPQLPDSNGQLSRRTRILVNGMIVDNLRVVESEVEILHNVGTLCWIDLRGEAAPVLTANRLGSKESQSLDWKRELKEMVGRFRQAINSAFRDQPLWRRQDIACSIGRVGVTVNDTQKILVMDVVERLDHHFQPHWKTPQRLELATQLYWLEQTAQNRLGRDQLLLSALDDAESDAREVDLDVAKKIRKARTDAGHRDFWSSRADRYDVYEHVDLAIAIASSSSHFIKHSISIDLMNAGWRSTTFTVNDGQTKQIMDNWELLVTTHLFPELFEPDLSRAHGLMRSGCLKGRLSHGVLRGPLAVELGISGKSVFAGRDPEGIESGQITRDYDLVVPLTNVPCGQLRGSCPDWSTDRWLRLVLLTPFLVPGSPRRWLNGTSAITDVIGNDSLLLLIPNAELWGRRFSEWTEDDWKNCVTSALWDINNQKVYWACGVTTRTDILHKGRTLCQSAHLGDD